MTGQADVRLCKSGGSWQLVKWMHQSLSEEEKWNTCRLWVALSKCFLYYLLAQCCMFLRQIFMILQVPRGFNKQWWLMKHVDYFDQRYRFLFFPNKKATYLVLITSWTENISLIRMKLYLCFHKCPLVLCYAFKLCKHYNLFQSFFHTILYRFTVQNLVMCKFTYSTYSKLCYKQWR